MTKRRQKPAVRLSDSVKRDLDTMKLVDTESYESIIKRLILEHKKKKC